jgi:RNA polymerase sigma factor (sigma-70 family)
VRSDEALAQGVQQGNQADMTELVNRYYDSLLNFLYRMCGGRQALAEDMVQETFLRVLRKITLYDANRPFKPWLYTIATNIARNYHQQADTRYTENPADEADYEDGNPQPEFTLMQAETAENVAKALAQLPEHQREVVVLFYYEEMAQKDIATVLDIPVGTVKSRLSLGLKRLRSTLSALDTQR